MYSSRSAANSYMSMSIVHHGEIVLVTVEHHLSCCMLHSLHS